MSDQTKQLGDDPLYNVTTDPGEDSLPITSIASYPVTTVQIDSLVFEDSPRLAGEDPGHTRLLAEVDDVLPPIMVHRPTMRVIDGMHRVRAALLNGKSVIETRLLDCDERTAFVLAVKANVIHGLLLSPSDRKAAAARIIASHPQWSDRAVAVSTGLSDKTVSGIRACATAEAPQSNTRLGRDGRLRPLNSAAKRQQAAAMINDKPEAGLRAIARATGLSPTTVRDVRQRADRCEDPIPPRYRSAENQDSSTASRLARKPSSRTTRIGADVDRHIVLAKLRNDPSLRFNEAGRRTLRWLHRHTVDSESWESLAFSVPDHCAAVVADLARSCAMAWTTLAELLEQRSRYSDN
jgi:ParB-like chromosome segregation protein Spo0J